MYFFLINHLRSLQQESQVTDKMPGTPIEQSNKTSENQETQRGKIDNEQPVEREITQTDRLNKQLLVCVLERMKKADTLYDNSMDKETCYENNSEDSDFK